MLTLKISDELQAKLGVKTSEELQALLEQKADSNTSLTALAAQLKTSNEQIDIVRASLAKLETTVAAIPAPIKLDEFAIVAKAEAAAKVVASGEVSAAIAKAGGAAIGTTATPPANPGNEAKDFKSLVTALVASGKAKTEAIKATIAQFPDAYKAWAATGGTL